MVLKTKDIERIEKAKIIIGSDGANSIIRNTFYKKNRIDKYISIQEWFENNTNSPFYSCIFDKSITDSYSWTISKDNYLIIGGAFPIKVSNIIMFKQKIHIYSHGLYYIGISICVSSHFDSRLYV